MAKKKTDSPTDSNLPAVPEGYVLIPQAMFDRYFKEGVVPQQASKEPSSNVPIELNVIREILLGDISIPLRVGQRVFWVPNRELEIGGESFRSSDSFNLLIYKQLKGHPMYDPNFIPIFEVLDTSVWESYFPHSVESMEVEDSFEDELEDIFEEEEEEPKAKKGPVKKAPVKKAPVKRKKAPVKKASKDAKKEQEDAMKAAVEAALAPKESVESFGKGEGIGSMPEMENVSISTIPTEFQLANVKNVSSGDVN